MAGPSLAIRRRPVAVIDLIEIGDYLAQAASLATSDRFLDAVEATSQQIARMPGVGTRYETADPLLTEIRVCPISGFRNYLLFYRVHPDRIEILRILHGAQDIPSILRDDLPVDP